MGIGKWITGAIGWALGGPLGGLVGYLLGSLFDGDQQAQRVYPSGGDFLPMSRGTVSWCRCLCSLLL